MTRKNILLFAVWFVSPAFLFPNARVVLNPYEGVDWKTVETHKANLHTHTTESDGSLSAREVVDLYEDAGYTIFSLTDHDTIDPEEPTWPWDAYGIDMDAIGMLPVLGNEISRPHHIGSYFNDYGEAAQRSEPEALVEIGRRGGLAVMFHPGRYSHRRTVDWYVDLYERFPHLVGMEVFNQNDRYPEDRRLYDAVLGVLMPDRPVWAMGNDDFHRMEHFARSFNLFLLPPGGLNEETFRDAFERGRFHTVHNPSRDTAQVIVPEAIHVRETAIELVVECREDQVIWISHGHEIHRGKSLPLSMNLGDYVRVLLEGGDGTQTLLQPFGLGGTEERKMTEVTVSGGSGSDVYLTGSRGIPIEADEPPPGKVFDRWSGDTAGVEDVRASSTSFDVPAEDSLALEALFRPAVDYVLTVAHGEGSADVPEESHQWIFANVPEGKAFDVWTGDVDGVEDPRSPTTRIGMPARDATVNATFSADPVYAPHLQNPNFADGLAGWQAKEEDVRFVEAADGSRHLAVRPFSGIMQRIEGMDLKAGQRLTLYFDAKIEAERSPDGFVGMQLLAADNEELVHTSITVRRQEWTSMAVSGEVVEGVVTPNIFVWMRRGDLHLKNFRLRVH